MIKGVFSNVFIIKTKEKHEDTWSSCFKTRLFHYV